MPKGVRLTLTDKIYRLASTVTVNEFVTGVAEMFAFSLKDNSAPKLHDIFGEMNVRAQMMLQKHLDAEAKDNADKRAAKALKRVMSVSKAQIVKATAPKKVRRTPKGQAGKPDTGKTIQRRKRRAF